MVRDAWVLVITAPTVREADGLAMSSRNSYLDDQQRAAAPASYQALQEAAEALRGGDVAGVDKVLADAEAAVLAAGFTKVEYMALCDRRQETTPRLRLPKSGADEARADEGRRVVGVNPVAAAFVSAISA